MLDRVVSCSSTIEMFAKEYRHRIGEVIRAAVSYLIGKRPILLIP